MKQDRKQRAETRGFRSCSSHLYALIIGKGRHKENCYSRRDSEDSILLSIRQTPILQSSSSMNEDSTLIG